MFNRNKMILVICLALKIWWWNILSKIKKSFKQKRVFTTPYLNFNVWALLLLKFYFLLHSSTNCRQDYKYALGEETIRHLVPSTCDRLPSTECTTLSEKENVQKYMQVVRHREEQIRASKLIIFIFYFDCFWSKWVLGNEYSLLE